MEYSLETIFKYLDWEHKFKQEPHFKVEREYVFHETEYHKAVNTLGKLKGATRSFVRHIYLTQNPTRLVVVRAYKKGKEDDPRR